MEHLVTLITGIAWPISIIVLAYLFRKDISKGLAKLTKIKYKDLEAEFSETIKQIEEQMPELQLEDEGDVYNQSLVRQREEIQSLGRASPRAAILEAWLELERTLLRAAQYKDIPIDRDIRRVTQELVKHSPLTATVSDLVDSLRRLRNLAVHETEFDLTQNAVDEYIYRALNVAVHIDFITNPQHREHFRHEPANRVKGSS